MAVAHIIATTDMPDLPPSDFAFSVNFKKGVGPASRVFTATSAFIHACEQIDADLVGSIDATIEPVMVLEDIEVGSLKTWLGVALKSTDDQGIKELNWKPLVGRYLVKAKYLVLRWTEDPDRPDIGTLASGIDDLAKETDVLRFPYYSPIKSASIVRAVTDFDQVKDHLVEGDEASMVTPDHEVAFNLAIRIDIDDIESIVTGAVEEYVVQSMVVFIKKPDYLSNSMWELRHGPKSIGAKIEDAEWLDAFQTRRVDLRPGDAIKCQMRVELLYGYDNELGRVNTI